MLNSSLITLNIDNSYRKLIDRDQCLPSTTARALMTFQVFKLFWFAISKCESLGNFWCLSENTCLWKNILRDGGASPQLAEGAHSSRR